MPEYEIFIDGKPRKIELTRTGENSFTAKIGDKSISAELTAEKPDLTKEFSIQVGNRMYQVELSEIQREKPFLIKVEEATFKAEVRTSTRASTLTTFEPTSPMLTKPITTIKQAVEGAVTAPMTGKILSIRVKKGDIVKAGQILCILEAMKMENEIAASKAGTVRETYVSEGSSVSEGEPLFLVD